MFSLQPPRHISTLPVATEPFSDSSDLCLLLPQERPFAAWVTDLRSLEIHV